MVFVAPPPAASRASLPLPPMITSSPSTAFNQICSSMAFEQIVVGTTVHKVVAAAAKQHIITAIAL